MKKKNKFLLIFCAFAVLCFYQSGIAQSGRRPKPTPIPIPQTIAEKSTPNSKEIRPPVKIESLLIVGEVHDDYWYSTSDPLGLTLKQSVKQLESHPKLTVKASNGGKMNFKEAQDRAKSETEIYVLWLGFVMKKGDSASVDYVEYAILKPESAKKVTTGRINPESLSKLKGVLGIPSTKLLKEVYPLKYVARGLIYKLIDEGWLNN